MTEQRVHYGEPGFDEALAERFDPDVVDIVALSAELCAVPGVTVPASQQGMSEVIRTAGLVRERAQELGLQVIEFEPTQETPYPFLIVTFAEHDLDSPEFNEAVALIGHVDVVRAKSEEQFSPFVEGEDLHARGATDMKTVDATYLVWMARRQRMPGPKPPVLLTLSCTEENGSPQPHNSATAFEWLREAKGIEIRFAVVGERTGELEWMDPPPIVGPVCAENRSWRWIRVAGSSGRGVAELEMIAETIELGRVTIATLNAVHTPEEKTARQPGVRSGFVNPFCIIVGDEDAHPADAVWLQAERVPGTAIHSAQATASDLSLLESFWYVAREAAKRFGPDQVHLAGVEIGEDRNFNTYDGSGLMKLAMTGTEADSVTAWAKELDTGDIELSVSSEPLDITGGSTVVGIDIRELLDHKDSVEELIAKMREQLSWGTFEMANDLPPWRCPDDHPDLVALRAAWERTVGSPSPDLVKLHGNDGGHLAAMQQGDDPEAARLGSGTVVVFGQVGAGPHGPKEYARATSIRPYLDILHAWADTL
jgi:acetylornithine deacetylase/succinyl-diaminopimelate desuccinylase-like protein